MFTLPKILTGFQRGRAPFGEGVRGASSPSPAPVTLLDGGMGQELIRRAGDPPSPLWATRVMLDHPHLVGEIHRDYFAAGSTVATTNSYALHHDRLRPNAHDHRFHDLFDAALTIAEGARAAHGSGRLAGSTGPLGASYRPEIFPDHDTGTALYAEVAAILAPRVDLIVGETVASIAHARALVAGVRRAAPGTPLWLALTVQDRDGTRLRSGEALADIAPHLQGVDAVLVNCSAPEAIDQSMPVLAALGLPFGGYGNGFQMITDDFLKDNPTDDVLKNRPEMTPERYADFAMGWVAHGATIVGGCCETGPGHIAEIARRLRAAGHRIV